MGKKRVGTYDALKFFAIFLVVWGHSLAWFSSAPDTDTAAYRFIYSFHMPLFMCVSGMFSVGLLNLSFSDMIKKRHGLLIPVITVGIPLSLFCVLTQGVDFLDAWTLSLWFLVSLFLCTLLFYVTMHNAKHRTLMFFVGLLISQVIAPVIKHNFFINFMYPAFLLGALLQWNMAWFKKNSKWLAVVSLIIFIVLLMGWTSESFNIKFDYHSKDGLMLFVRRYAHKQLIGLSGATFFISLFEMMSAYVPSTKVGDKICAWGRETLAIYILSGVILNCIVARFVQFEGVNLLIYQFILTPVIALACIYVCIVLVNLIYRSKWMSLLILGKSKNS